MQLPPGIDGASVIDGFSMWGPKYCRAWTAYDANQKAQIVGQYFADRGLSANGAAVRSVVTAMDSRCETARVRPVAAPAACRPAGAIGDGLEQAFADAENSDQPSEFERVATDRNFNQTVQSAFRDVTNVIGTAINSANRTNTYAPNNNPVGGFGGLGGYPQGSGVVGGFNSPYGYGAGAISWTPIIIGGVVVFGLGALLLTSQKR